MKKFLSLLTIFVLLGGATYLYAAAGADKIVTIHGTAPTMPFYDEDTMSSNDARGVASQQSIKAYVDNQTTLTEDVTATNVLTATECGTTYFLNSATEFATTLPAVSTVSAGCAFRFIVKAAPSGANYTVISGNSLENVITGGVVERETDTGDDGPYVADGDTITIADGVAVAGDYFELISDGSKFYMHGQVNADGAITPTQAD